MVKEKPIAKKEEEVEELLSQHSGFLKKNGRTFVTNYDESDDDVCLADKDFFKKHGLTLPELENRTKKCVPVGDSSQDFLTYKFKKYNNNIDPKPKDELFLNGEKSSGRYIMSTSGKWYAIRENDEKCPVQ